MKTAAFNTLGCKVNQYETQVLREQFTAAGFKIISAREAADIYVINTCTVTSRTDTESRRLIRNAIRRNPDAKVVVTGCYAELDKEEIEKISKNIIIVKNSGKNNIISFLNTFQAEVSDTSIQKVSDTTMPLQMGPDTMHGITRFSGRTKAFIKVQDGCDNFCSYCKVPFVRGRSRSRDLKQIIAEIDRVVANGYKEIILTGICLGDWGRGTGLGLSRLIDEIENRIQGDFRIRISSIEPWYVSSGLLEKVASVERICKHLHIPMQSGDDKILEKMNRRFSSGDFIDLIKRFKKLIPGGAFTTDIIVGFPGETQEQFNNTLKTVELTKPSKTHIFPFSERKGTGAALIAREAVPAKIARERIGRLRSVTDKLESDYKNAFLGKAVKALVEMRRDKKTNLLTGFTDTYIKVSFQGPDEWKGKIVAVPMT